MSYSLIYKDVLASLEDLFPQESEEAVDQLCKEIASAKRVFIGAAGRSLLVMKGFAMRLMHLGFDCHVAGEVTCPAIREGDLLILGSSSGETKTLMSYVETAKKNNARIALLSNNPSSSIGLASDCVVKLNKNGSRQYYLSAGSVFEETLMLVCDSISSYIYLNGNYPEGDIDEYIMIRHANLQ